MNSMNQSMEQLLDTSLNLDGCSNSVCDELDCCPPLINFENYPTIQDDVDQTVPSNFVLGPYKSERLSAIHENWSTDGYSSLPVEILQKSEMEFAKQITAWEAEDTKDFMTTLDESCILDIESLESVHQIQEPIYWSPPKLITTSAEIHNSSPKFTSTPIKNLFDTKSADSSLNSSQIFSTNTFGGGPVEKYPKIMTQSCYGELPSSWNVVVIGGNKSDDDEISVLNKSTDDLLKNDLPKNRKAKGGTQSLNTSFYEGCNSMNSSFIETKSMDSSMEISLNRIITEIPEDFSSSDGSKLNGWEGSNSTDIRAIADNGESIFFICLFL